MPLCKAFFLLTLLSLSIEFKSQYVFIIKLISIVTSVALTLNEFEANT